jgi:sugar transferase (PEP-CTERM/EpsH1 system associated)
LKILFLANRIPYPPYRGDKLKIYNLAKRLCHKHELHLVTFIQDKKELEYRFELTKIFKTINFVYLPKWLSALNCIRGLVNGNPFQVNYFNSPAMRRLLNDVVRSHQFDAVHVQHLRMAQYMAEHKDLPRILDLPDAFSLYWERRQTVKKGFARAFFEKVESKRVLKYESIINEYDMSLACSTEDINYLKQKHHSDNINLLPNGVDIDMFTAGGHDYSNSTTLLFTGNMDYAPNIDAVIYFSKEILPQIRAKFPDVHFVIAGQHPVKKVQDLANDFITVTGFVKDLAPVYNSASIVVAPLRFGAGTQNKVLEAMAMGVPVVCSNIGFNGLGIESGQGAIMQTAPEKFAESVIQLLSSAQLRQQVGEAGVNVIHSRFGWNAIATQLEGYFIQIVNSRHSFVS